MRVAEVAGAALTPVFPLAATTGAITCPDLDLGKDSHLCTLYYCPLINISRRREREQSNSMSCSIADVDDDFMDSRLWQFSIGEVNA